MLRITIAAALLLAPHVCSQSASFTYYGSGCALFPSYAPSQLTVSGPPRLGSTVQLKYTSGHVWSRFTWRTVVLLTGLSDTQAYGLPLPYLTRVLGGGPCFVLCSPDIAIRLPADVGSLQIPNAPSLLGLTLYQQFWATYHDNWGSWSTWYQFSNAVKLVIGT